MAHYLITGAAGFIGCHLTKTLLNKGHSVHGVDNLSLGTNANLGESSKHPSFTFSQVDVSDADFPATFKAEKPVDAVWHLAANSDIPAGVENPGVDLKDTFLTSLRLLEWMRRHRVLRLAFASTSAVYGERTEPITEDSGPMFPISNYGAMKLASEALISAAAESWLTRVDIFRFPNVIGSRSTHGALLDFIRRLRLDSTKLDVLGNGSQEKPYLHVADLVAAMLFITETSDSRFGYFNIGPTDTITVREMAEEVVSHVAPGATIRFGDGSKGWVGDVARFTYSTEKLRSLGWKHSLSSRDAVRRAIREIAADNP